MCRSKKRNCKLEYESYDALFTHPNSSGKYIEVRARFWLSALQERAESQKRLKASTSRVRMTNCQID